MESETLRYSYIYYESVGGVEWMCGGWRIWVEGGAGERLNVDVDTGCGPQERVVIITRMQNSFAEMEA